MAALTLGLLVPVVAAAVLLSKVLVAPSGWPARLLAVSLAVGLTLGVTSLLFFLWLVLFPSSGLAAYCAIEVAFLLGLGVGGRFLRRREVPSVEPTSRAAWSPSVWLGYSCLASVLCAAICFVIYSAKSPHGDIDAWAIWNNRARFLIRAGADWRETFQHPRLGWSHPDYPLLVPGSVARLWRYRGEETVLAPCLIGGLLTFATAGLLISALCLLRDRSQGYLTGILLFSSPFYLEVGSAQYADVPLAYFFLATLVLWCLERTPAGGQSFAMPLLAGLTAGLAAWTKNEGIVFFLVVFVVRLLGDAWAANRRTRLRRTGLFLIGALPVLIVLAYFKMRIAPRSDLLTNLGQRPAVHLLLVEGHRYWVIVREAVIGLGRSLSIALVGLLVCSVCLGRRPGRGDGDWIRVGTVLGLMILGYFGVYFFASWENLQAHVRLSVDRLWIQLFPTLLLFFGLRFATPEEVRQAHAGVS
jgi:hypothetical protein